MNDIKLDDVKIGPEDLPLRSGTIVLDHEECRLYALQGNGKIYLKAIQWMYCDNMINNPWLADNVEVEEMLTATVSEFGVSDLVMVDNGDTFFTPSYLSVIFSRIADIELNHLN